MAVLAEPSIEVTDDRLAARNALVLAVAQALAGGNLTVIVATGGIVGSILAPDPVLATLPISVMVVGMWLGTLAGRDAGQGLRAPLRVASRLGVGRAVGRHRLRRHAPGIVFVAAPRCAVRGSLRRRASILSLRRHRHRER